MDLVIKRFIALLVDCLIVYIPSFLIYKLLDIFVFSKNIIYIKSLLIVNLFNWLESYIIFIILFVSYFVLFEYKYKRSYGHRIMKLKVKYNKKSLSKIILRAFIKAVSLTSFYYSLALISLIMMIIMDSETSIHDYIVGSKVCVK